MLKRLQAIVLIYATRRLLWLWGLMYVAFLVMGWVATDDTRPWYFDVVVAAMPSPGRAVINRRDLERLLNEGRSREIVVLDCRNDWPGGRIFDLLRRLTPKQRSAAFESTEERSSLPDFDRLPALRVLNLNGCMILPAAAKRLSRCTTLEWLSLEGATIVDGDLKFLAGLPHLHTLVVGQLRSGNGEPLAIDLPPLPGLRTLDVEESPPLRHRTLSSVRQSPRLTELIVKLQPGETLDAKSIASIHAIPTLRRLFVGGYRDDPANFRRLCAALPAVRVWHTEMDQGRVAAAGFLLLVLLTVCAGPTAQVVASFSLPDARLFPNFCRAHVLVPLGIGAAGFFWQTLIAGRFGAAYWAVLSIQVFVAGLWASIATVGVSFPRIPWPPGLRGRAETRGEGAMTSLPAAALIRIVLLLLLVTTYLTVGLHPYVAESFLLGELPWTNFGLLLIGVALIGTTGVLLRRLNVSLNEAGVAPEMSWSEAERPSQRTGLASRGQQRRLARLPQRTSRESWSWHVRAVSAVNPETFYSYLLIVVVGVGILFAWNLFRSSPGPLRSDAFLPLVSLELITALGILARNSGNWWQRRTAFQSQLLYPWTRREMTSAAFGAWALENGGPPASALIVGLGLFFGLNSWFGWHVPAMTILAGALASLAILAMFIGGVFWLLTLRHALFAGLLVYLGGVAILVVVINTAIWVASRTDPIQHLPVTLLCVTLECAAIATVLSILAYRRWMRMEWGLIGPR